MNRVSSYPTGGARRGAAARAVLGVFAALFLVAAAAGAGFWYGLAKVPQRLVPPQAVAALGSMFKQEREALEAASLESQAQLDAFAGRIGEMQAEILRLNALGERLVEMAGLDATEFDFQNAAPVGGPDDAWALGDTGVEELRGEMTDMLSLISDRERKLKQLERAIMEDELEKHATPAGWPVRSGYISSKFGYRRHPIRKKSHFHSGIDFASKRGTSVIATADGVVVFSGWKGGYGRLVEIRHMDGLRTRYGHNQKNLVKEGDMVEKGQTIALVGSSGRSTGPHVHFEVRSGGKPVNPMKYVSAGGPTKMTAQAQGGGLPLAMSTESTEQKQVR